MIRSLAIGALASFGVAYVIHGTQGSVRDLLMLTSATVLGQEIYWSWAVFLVVSMVGWLIERAVKT